LGLIAGMIAGKLFKSNGDDPKLDLVVGVIGAVIGGVLVGLMGHGGMASFNAWSMLLAAVGALGLLMGWHAFRAFAARG
jgi:uncharacterized membrane protein YeaQ/YmgE (transglycosylase-associated protein family)